MYTVNLAVKFLLHLQCAVYLFDVSAVCLFDLHSLDREKATDKKLNALILSPSQALCSKAKFSTAISFSAGLRLAIHYTFFFCTIFF